MTSRSPADTRQNKQPGYEALTLLLVDCYCRYDSTLACSYMYAALYCSGGTSEWREKKKEVKNNLSSRFDLFLILVSVFCVSCLTFSLDL